MKTDRDIEQQHETSDASAARMTQAQRMRAAVEQAVAVAPGFLRGDVDADHMATTMIHAVGRYVERERAAGTNDAPQDAEAQALQATLAELMGCGSGYLAGRCDAACVARTMTQMVREFAMPSVRDPAGSREIRSTCRLPESSAVPTTGSNWPPTHQ